MDVTLDNFPPSYTEQVFLVIGIISVVMNILGIYVIIYQSPSSMYPYKYILLAMILVSFTIDIYLTNLLTPVPIPGNGGTQVIGVLARLFPKHGVILLMIGLAVLQATISMSVVGFLYREHMLLNFDESSISKYFRYFQLLTLVIATFFGCPIGVYLLSVPIDSELGINITKTAVLVPGAAYFLINGSSYATFFLPLTYVIYLSFLFLSMVRTIGRINRFLHRRRASMSVQTLRMQKMLLRALIWQTIIPSFCLLGPAFALVLLAIFSRFAYTVKLSVRMTAYVYMGFVLGFFSSAHVSSMLYFTLPYRDFFLRRFFGIERRISVSVVTPTNSSP